MAKRRFQNPDPFRSGRWWYLLHWSDVFIAGKLTRKRTRRKLAPASMAAREVKKIAAEFLGPMNRGTEIAGSAMPFQTFVETYYIADLLPLLAKSSRDRSVGILKNYLFPAFGNKPLRDLNRSTIQAYFSGLSKAGNLSHQSIDKIRDTLAAVLAPAVTDGLLHKNPVTDVRLAPDVRGHRAKPFIRPEHFASLLELIPEPYASMVHVAIFTGLRASEVIGLKWKCVHVESNQITIDEKYTRGEWGRPKSKSSNATIAVNQAVIDRILRLKTLTIEVKAGNAIRRFPAVKGTGDEDLVFASVITGQPMRDNNVLTRFIKPAGRKLGLPFVNWQVLRRSHATWLRISGADLKDIQSQMRHSRASTTADIYMQFTPESQRRAVDKLTELTGAGYVN